MSTVGDPPRFADLIDAQASRVNDARNMAKHN